jgi:hypothetical protein
LDYKKLILYFIIIVVAVGIWFRNGLIEKRRLSDAERFAEVYAGTAVMAELYRNEPKEFFAARDSILSVHGVDSSWVRHFQNKFEGHEERWIAVWSRINAITDSLIEYYKEHPVTHDTTGAADTTIQSSGARNDSGDTGSSHQ